jgi:Ca2+-binding EF-hand superfamily protein
MSSCTIDINTKELFKEFPVWSQQELHDLKLRFQVLDINADGLLDEHEMSS